MHAMILKAIGQPLDWTELPALIATSRRITIGVGVLALILVCESTFALMNLSA